MSQPALPSSLLFACNRNSVRSPMAAALASHYLGSGTYIASCGVDPGELDPFAVAVMAEFGIDMAGHRPQSFEELDDGSFDLIVTLAPEAHHRALEFTRTWSVEVEYWPTADPTVALENRGRARSHHGELSRCARGFSRADHRSLSSGPSQRRLSALEGQGSRR